jgi:hypothetical protein
MDAADLSRRYMAPPWLFKEAASAYAHAFASAASAASFVRIAWQAAPSASSATASHAALSSGTEMPAVSVHVAARLTSTKSVALSKRPLCAAARNENVVASFRSKRDVVIETVVNV